MKRIVIYILLCLLSATMAFGEGLRMPVYFADHMVIQREKNIRIAGQASAGEKVRIALGKIVRETEADISGKWMVCFDPMAAGGPYELMVNTDNDTLCFSDILIGDVWFAAGQSNMAFRLRTLKKEDFEKEKAEAVFSQIRYYGTAGVISGGKPVESPDQKWSLPQADRIADWSAIAYLFAKEIYRRYRIPVGIIACAQGSSTAEAWLSPAAYETDPGLVRNIAKEYTGVQALYRNPSVLFRNMLSRFEGITVKGVIWYQGESNAYDPAKYKFIFSGLIKDWRSFFGDPDLPFIYAQLPAYRMPGDQSGEKWAEIRQVQLDISRQISHTAMVVTSEYGEAGNIHPKNKYPVARRFVSAAEGLAYGEKLLYQIEIPEVAEQIGNKARLVFPDEKIRLVVKGQMMLEICGEDGTYYPADYTVRKNSLSVWAGQVAVPVRIRYAYTNVNQLALYDRSGVPVSPFCIPVK